MSRSIISKRVGVVAACVSLFVLGVVLGPQVRDASRELPNGVTPGFAQSSASPGRSVAAQLSDAFESAADRVSPSVVPIYAEKTMEVSSEMNDFFERYFGRELPDNDQSQTLRSVGSGVVAREGGYILTNNHVVDDAEKLTVVTDDGKRHTAKVIGTDPATDLAVIQVENVKGLPVAQFGTSDNLRVGQWVIAVGNPFQLLHSVTAGIISARGRSSIGLAAYEDFIQTDASINPGNSGGALADLDGRVIGINTAIASNTGVGAGVGFAIPIDMAKQIMAELIDEGQVTRGYLALLPQDITEDLAKALKLKDTDGALVGGVTPGGPADKGGVERGDVIVAFNGKKIKNAAELRAEVAREDPKKAAKLTVIRDGKSKELKVTLGERPSEAALRGQGEPEDERGRTPEKLQQDFGLSVQDLTPAMARELDLDNVRGGAVVVGVRGGSAASNAGLARGDLIVEIDGKAVRSAEDVEEMLSKVGENQSVALLVRRGDNTFYAPLERG